MKNIFQKNKVVNLSLLLLGVVNLTGCGNGSHMPVEMESESLNAKRVTFDQVKPVFEKRCSICHIAMPGKNWTNFENSKAYAKKIIIRVMIKKDMPTLGTPYASQITLQERKLIAQWVKDGAQAENINDKPIPKSEQEDPIANNNPTEEKNENPEDKNENKNDEKERSDLPLYSKIQIRCDECHNPEYGEKDAPYLVRQHKEVILTEMGHFKNNNRSRDNKDLQKAHTHFEGKKISNENIKKLAEYYASQKFELKPNRKSRLSMIGKKKATTCLACHYDPATRKSIGPLYPNLAGQKSTYIERQLKAFKKQNKDPKDPEGRFGIMMPGMAAGIAYGDIKAISKYFSSLKSPSTANTKKAPRRPGPNGKLLFNKNCTACHGSNGKGAIPPVPDMTKKNGRLSKPRKLLIDHALNGFRSKGSYMKMPPKGGNPRLSKKDIVAIIDYMLETFKPKK